VKSDDALPDSCFVEDTAFVFDGKTIICNMSVKSRAPEVVGVADVLGGLKEIHYVKPPAMIDGGDILKIENRVLIGRSARTNSAAIEQVGKMLRDSGLDAVPVVAPPLLGDIDLDIGILGHEVIGALLVGSKLVGVP
jgi:dimethylargininase